MGKSLKRRAQALFRSALTLCSPELNTKVCYRVKFGRSLNLVDPKTINEKILWLKLNNYMRNPLVKKCADKYLVREYIDGLGYGDILIPLIACYDSPAIPNWDELPSSFVLKLNSGCGHNLVISDKGKFNRSQVEGLAKKWFKAKDWIGYSELQYKDVPKKLLVEKNICGQDGSLPTDYKFFCMNGECKCVLVCEDRDIEARHANYYYLDKEWNLLPFTQEAIAEPSKVFSKPPQLDDAIKIAETISAEWAFLRVDLYLSGDAIYFGEMTFTPTAGMDNEFLIDISEWAKRPSPYTVDDYLGELMVLPE